MDHESTATKPIAKNYRGVNHSGRYYREVYLKSEHWKNLRLQKLVEADCMCLRCGHQSQHNDVHHLCYKGLYDVTTMDLVVLCRKCHDLVHEKLEQLKHVSQTDPYQKAFESWKLFVETWGPHPNDYVELRNYLVNLRKSGKMRSSPKPPKPAETHFKKLTVFLDPADYKVYERRALEMGLRVSEWLPVFLREKLG